MSEHENTEMIKAAYGDFARGDINAILQRLTEDVDWSVPGPTDVLRPAGHRRGRAAVAEFFNVLMTDQEALRFEPQRFVAQGDIVVALGQYEWRILANGAVVATDFAHVFTISGGLVKRFEEFADTALFVEAHRKSPVA